MTILQAEKRARRKLSLLHLAEELGTVSNASKIVGHSRQQFYEIRRSFQTSGAEGLADLAAGPRNPHAGGVSAGLVETILPYPLSIRRTARGEPRRVAAPRVQFSSGGVRGVWSRDDQPTIDRETLVGGRRAAPSERRRTRRTPPPARSSGLPTIPGVPTLKRDQFPGIIPLSTSAILLSSTAYSAHHAPAFGPPPQLPSDSPGVLIQR